MKKIVLKCDSCGATMELEENQKIAVCPFCKNKYYLDKEPDIEKLASDKEKMTYAEQMGRIKAMSNYQRKKNLKVFVTIIGIFILVITIIIFIAKGYVESLEYVEDPFECINVEFSGDDNNGQLIITDNKKCDYFYELKYKSTKSYKLKQGEKINISVYSSDYRFGVSSKEYKVTGLNIYLTDLSELTEPMIKKIHNLSSGTIKTKSIRTYYNGKVKSLTPYKLYLLTNKEDKNYLFDVYKLVNKSNSGKTYTKYVVAYYEDVVFTNNENLFKYIRLRYAGDMINAGSSKGNIFNDGIGYIYGFNNMNEFESYLAREFDSALIKKVK